MAHYVTMSAATDTDLSAKPNTLLLGLFNSGDANVNAVQVCWAVYVPSPFMPIMLAGDLTPI